LFCRKLSQRLRGIAVQTLREALDSSSRIVFYKSIKIDFIRESYLDQIENSYFRSTIVKLRGGLLSLGYNTGFFNNKPIDQRICPLCYNITLF
jgi:hypothetical protein